jgi:hypothetical protein
MRLLQRCDAYTECSAHASRYYWHWAGFEGVMEQNEVASKQVDRDWRGEVMWRPGDKSNRGQLTLFTIFNLPYQLSHNFVAKAPPASSGDAFGPTGADLENHHINKQ